MLSFTSIVNRGIIAVFGVAVFFAILFGSIAFDSVLAQPQPKEDICHVDPDGDGAGLETLSVNGHSVDRHLAHGDHRGECFVCRVRKRGRLPRICEESLAGQKGAFLAAHL